MRVVAIGVLAAKLVHLPSTLFGQANMANVPASAGSGDLEEGRPVDVLHDFIDGVVLSCSSSKASITKGFLLRQTLMHKLPTNFLARGRKDTPQ